MLDACADAFVRVEVRFKSTGISKLADMSIGQVARRMGCRPSAIRYYERLGLLAKPPRVAGRRRYDDHVLERLAMIRFAKHVGFSMSEVRLLLAEVEGRPPTERWRKLATEKAVQVDAFIAQASAVRKLLQETLDHKCPKLVERGRALSRTGRLGLRIHRSRP